MPRPKSNPSVPVERRKSMRNLFVQDRNWFWAKSRAEGASKFIDALLSREREREERDSLLTENRRLREEVARLQALLNATGRSDGS